MSFEDFKTACKKVIYDNPVIIDGEDLTPENIKCVENFPDMFEGYFDEGLTPFEAVEQFKLDYE